MAAPPDPRWLELLKASGWQTFAIAIACAVFLAATHYHILPTPPEGATLMVGFGLLLCMALTLTALVSGTLKFFAVRSQVIDWSIRRRQLQRIKAYLPYMTDEEKRIVGYLLHHNQKIIVADQDGGHAMTLISRGILQPALRAGQVFNATECPFAVPDKVWDVLVAHKDNFPFNVATTEAVSHPWRKHWMAR